MVQWVARAYYAKTRLAGQVPSRAGEAALGLAAPSKAGKIALSEHWMR